MSVTRAERDELERLDVALASARARVETLTADARRRSEAAVAREQALRAQRGALAAQLTSLERLHQRQSVEIEEVISALQVARRAVVAPSGEGGSVGQVLDSLAAEKPNETWLEQIATTPTPGYARSASWFERLIERWIVGSGRSWK